MEDYYHRFMNYTFDYQETKEIVSELIPHHRSRGFTIEQAISQTIEDLEIANNELHPVNFIITTLALKEYLAESETIFIGIANHYHQLKDQINPLQWQQILTPFDRDNFASKIQQVEIDLKNRKIITILPAI